MRSVGSICDNLLLTGIKNNLKDKLPKKTYQTILKHTYIHKALECYEFHIHKNRYLPKGLYLTFRACSKTEARAKGLSNLMEHLDSVKEEK